MPTKLERRIHIAKFTSPFKSSLFLVLFPLRGFLRGVELSLSQMLCDMRFIWYDPSFSIRIQLMTGPVMGIEDSLTGSKRAALYYLNPFVCANGLDSVCLAPPFEFCYATT